MRRSLETVRRSELSDAAGYGYCRSHSRWCYGFRLHLAAAPDSTPRAAIPAPAYQKERDIALKLLPRALHAGELVLAACVWLNHQLGRPSRSLIAYTAYPSAE